MNDKNGLAEMNSHQPLQLIRVELDQDQAILTVWSNFHQRGRWRKPKLSGS